MTTSISGDGLLRYLQVQLGGEHLEFAERPTQITGGFETSIFGFRLATGALTSPLILRVYPAYEDPNRAVFEKTVHNSLAAAGFPAPRVHFACTDSTVLGAPFVVMDRIPGRTLVADFLRPATLLRIRLRAFGFVSKTLADLQLRLHSIDPDVVGRALASEGLPPTAGPDRMSRRPLTFAGKLEVLHWRLVKASLGGLQAGHEWLAANAPASGAEVVCHGDFHPLNVISERGNATGVIDWSLATIAPPAFDVGNTLMILKFAPRGPPGPVRRATIQRYLKAYSVGRVLAEEEVTYFEAYRCLRSLAWAGESRQAAAGVIDDRAANPWSTPSVAVSLRRALRANQRSPRQPAGLPVIRPSNSSTV